MGGIYSCHKALRPHTRWQVSVPWQSRLKFLEPKLPRNSLVLSVITAETQSSKDGLKSLNHLDWDGTEINCYLQCDVDVSKSAYSPGSQILVLPISPVYPFSFFPPKSFFITIIS